MENTEVVIYRSGDGSVSVEALVDSANETIWATQKSIADLFGVGVNTINHHIKSIYKCAELQAYRTIRKNRIVRNETLVALTLMIAESRMDEMDIMLKVIVNLINNR